MYAGRLGAAIRLLRQRRRWTQADLGARAGVSDTTISRIERGHVRSLTIATIQDVALGIEPIDRLDEGEEGDLAQVVGRRPAPPETAGNVCGESHVPLHELVARWFGEVVPAWVLAPEVSFSIYEERGVIDILAWHSERRALLVIELKTDIVDVNDLVGSADRRRRLARTIAAERGWDPATVSVWVLVSPSRTNRRRVAAHEAMLRAAFPMDGRGVRAWLRSPVGSVAALSFWPDSRAGNLRPDLTPARRIRRPRTT